jgi:hypothetical protein
MPDQPPLTCEQAKQIVAEKLREQGRLRPPITLHVLDQQTIVLHHPDGCLSEVRVIADAQGWMTVVVAADPLHPYALHERAPKTTP